MRTWVWPNSIGVLLWALLAIAQFTLVRHAVVVTHTSQISRSAVTAISSRSSVTERLGFPTIIERHETFDASNVRVSRSVKVEWLGVICLWLAFPMLNAVGRLATGGWGAARDLPPRVGRHRPVVTVLAAMLACVALGAAVGAGVSKWYWGFAFERPPVDRRIVEATHVDSYVRYLWYAGQQPGMADFIKRTGPSDPDEIADTKSREGGHYHLETRVDEVLHAKNLLSPLPPQREDAGLDLARKLIQSVRAQLDRRDNGNWEFTTVIDFVGPAGEPLTLISGRTNEVSNDHRVFYEFLFAGRLEDPSPRLLSVNRFYFDLAGMEGMTWYGIATGVSFLLGMIVLPLTLLAMTIRRLREGRSAMVRGFAVEVSSEV